MWCGLVRREKLRAQAGACCSQVNWASHSASACLSLLAACNTVACTLLPDPPVPLQVKCDQYWPARGTETYGLIQVTLVDTVELATYTMRTFALHKVWLNHASTRPLLGL